MLMMIVLMSIISGIASKMKEEVVVASPAIVPHMAILVVPITLLLANAPKSIITRNSVSKTIGINSGNALVTPPRTVLGLVALIALILYVIRPPLVLST